MGGGSVNAPHIDPRHPGAEQPVLGNWYQWQQGQLNDYVNKNPLLSAANTGALDFWKQLPGLTGPLKDLLGAAPGFYSGLQGQLGDLYGQGQGVFGNLGNISNQLNSVYGNLGGISNRLGGISQNFNGLIDRTRDLSNPLRNAYNNQINPVLQSGGRLTPQLARDVAQQTRGIESQMGTAHSTGALGRELLNRDAYREARFKDYLGMGNQTAGTLSGLLGQEGGFRGAQANIAGQQAGIAGQQAGIRGQQAGIAGQQGGILGLLSGITGQQGSTFAQQAGVTQGLGGAIQNLQTGGLNQLLGAQGANVSTFTGLENPILGYLGNLFGQNLQSRIAQAQIDTQANIANQSAGAGKAGGALSAGGSIISSILPLLAFSDERLKRKIRDTGMKSREGVPIKTFEYKTRPGVVMLGVLSKDVKAKVPSAVTREPYSGIELVDRRKFPIFELSATGKAAA